MKNVKILSVLSYSAIILSGISLFLANIFQSPISSVSSSGLLTIAILFFCISSFSKRVGIAVFFACFFTFQLAGTFIPFLLGDNEWNMGLTDREFIVTCNCLFLSCVVLIFTTIFLEKYKLVWGSVHDVNLAMLKDHSYNLHSIQKWAFLICIVSSLIAIVGETQAMFHAISHGYISMYDDYSSSALVNRMQLISKASMFIGLAANPSKKRAWTYFFLALPVAVMNLVEGSRTGVMTLILFFIYYFYSYADWGKRIVSAKEKKKRNRRLIIICIGIVCLIAPFLYVYGYTRVGNAVRGSSNPVMLIFQFFGSQGGSAKLIGWAESYKGELPGLCYSLGSIVDRIQGNHFTSFTVESAINTNSFGYVMSYLNSPYNFTVLHTGVGSSYVAEVYYDFGYVGLLIVNIVISSVLKQLTTFGKSRVLVKGIIFSVFYYMLTIPRAPLLLPVDNVLSLSSIMTFLVIFVLSKRRVVFNGKNQGSAVDSRILYGRGRESS